MLLIAAIAEWCLTSSMEIRASGMAAKLFWVKLEYIGGSWTGVFFLMFVLVITGREEWLTRRRQFLLGLIPLITIILALTNPFHHLVWADAWLAKDTPVPILRYDRAIGFWIFISYSYGLLAAGTVILIREITVALQLYRKKLTVILAGGLMPWIAHGLYLFDLSPYRHLDLTPFAFTLSALAFAWGLFRYQLASIISLAHKTIIEGMEDVVFVMDTKDRIIDLNNSASQEFNISAAAKGGLMARLSPVLHDHIVRFRQDSATQNEIRLEVGQNSRDWNLRISPLFEKLSKPGGWLIILQDITERMRAEEAIRESEEKFRSISTNALDGIVMIDSAGKITLWNQAAEKIFGYTALEAIGMKLHEKLAPSDLHAESNKAFPLYELTGGKSVIGKTLELKAIHKSGVTLPVELSVSSLKLKGEWHALGIVRDVSERIRTRDLMIQSEKMISVGRMAAGMAHELNNPLGGMLQGVQNVIRRFSPELKANHEAADALNVDLHQVKRYMAKREIDHYLDGILDLGKRAATIIADMLHFSRKSESTRSPVDLKESIGNAIELARKDYNIRKNFDFRDIEIITDFAPDVPKVLCNEIEIEQVFLNLLKNAAQAMKETAESRPQQITIRLYVERDMATVEVADNGPGIDITTQTRIFEPFYTTKMVGQGTGLGLSVSYMIITNHHHGKIAVESEVGRGTTVIIRLPLGGTPAE